MNDRDEIRLSKLISLILRHDPERAGITTDANGWVPIDALLAGLEHLGESLTRADLETIVENSDKQRFAIDESGTRIRANQGHSIPVDLGYEPVEPPEELFHGTTTRNVASIMRKGINRGSRHHVHLSTSRETAERVGKRHGKLALLKVRSGEMQRDGFYFYLSANGVWLTDFVPPRYIEPIS